MISESCDIKEFFREIAPGDALDLIHAAEKEATAAERRLYKTQKASGNIQTCCREYADALKTLIGYLRYSVKTPVSPKWLPLFQDAQKAFLRAKRRPS